MITDVIKKLIETAPHVFVATCDAAGQPHLAIAEQAHAAGDSILIFESWFCPATLQNIVDNPKVSVVAVLPGTGKGYQMLGEVVWRKDAAFLDGYDSNVYLPETPQMLTRFNVRVTQVLEFTSGIHTDTPLRD